MNAPGGATERVKILLVDDRPANLLSLKAILGDQPDYDLVTATSGEEALDRVLRDDFAVILMDVAMPGLDGFETARIVKSRERSSRIPIVFVTASVYDMEHVYQGYTVGAVDYLKKPIDPHAVRAKVAVFVELYRQARQIERQAARLREIERRELRAALDASEARFRRLRESGLIGIFFWEEDGRVTDANHAFLEMLGFGDKDLRAGSINVRELTPAEFDDADARATEELRAYGVCRTYEKEFLRADGSRVAVLLGAARHEDGDSGGIAFALDITERRRIELERTRLLSELRQAVRARDEFLSIAAHELKTPLTPLQVQSEGLLRAFERGNVAKEAVMKRLEMVRRSVVRLDRLIDTLLDVTRVTVGMMKLDLEETDLVALARETTDRLSEEFERAGSTLTMTADRPSIVGRWDRLRIEQVIENILANALKYGIGKPVEVEVWADDTTASFSVRDHGIGIARDEQQRIFERYERAAPIKNFGGFGLGLWIVRQIIEAHGGEVDVWSEPGQGARFTVRLPLAARVVGPAPTPASEPASP